MSEEAGPEMHPLAKLVSGRLKAQPAGPHPDPDLLSAFAENALPQSEKAQVLQHLGTCADCREILYLAMPDDASGNGAQPELLRKPRRRTAFAMRWATLAASVVIVGGLFLTRFQAHKQTSALSEPPLAKLAAKKVPAELDEMRDARSGDGYSVSGGKADTVVATNQNKTLPPAGHMTARPQAKFEIDKNEQIHMQPAAPAPQREEAEQVPGRGLESLQTGKVNGSAGKVNGSVVSGQAAASPSARPAVADKPAASSEMVEVTAEAPSNSTSADAGAAVSAEKADMNRKEKKQTAAEFGGARTKSAPIKSGAGGTALYRADNVARISAVVPQWTLSRAGAVQRSFDAGNTWSTVWVTSGVVFRSLSAVGTQVWVGGNHGTLFHSSDSGQVWTQVAPVFAGQKLSDDVIHIDFPDAQNGTIATAQGEVWITADGGLSWRRK